MGILDELAESLEALSMKAEEISELWKELFDDMSFYANEADYDIIAPKMLNLPQKGILMPTSKQRRWYRSVYGKYFKE